MANFAYTATKSFTPFTFEQMLKPMAMYTQEYNAIEEGIAELGSKADLMRMYANEEPDSKVANMYNAYANDLDKQAESLAKQGLTPSSRRGLLDLKRRYSSEITPIETAVTRRKQLAEEQRKAILANPSLMYDRYFSNAKLQDIIDNPELSYTPISGNELYAKGAAAAKSSSLRNLSFGQAKVLGDQYWQLTKRQGYSASQAAKFLADTNNIPELKDAIERIKAETGTSILGQNDLKRAENYIIDGIMSGLTYGESRDYKSNQDYEYAMRNWLEEEKEKRVANRKAQEQEKEKVEGIQGDRLGVGVEGTVSDVVKRLEGLRKTDTGYSTTALDRLSIPYQKAKKQLDEFETANPDLKEKYDKYQEELSYWNQRLESLDSSQRKSPNPNYAAARQAIIQQKPKFEGDITKLSEYDSIRKEYDKVSDPYNKELEYLSEVENKYSHLGRNSYEAMMIGLSLEDRQEKEANNPLILSFDKEADYNNARKRLSNLIGSFTEKEYKGNVGIYKVEEDGKSSKVSLDDSNKIINNDESPVRFRVDTGKNPRLLLIQGNQSYEIRGSQKIDRINKNLKAINNYLKDFESLGSDTSLNNTTYMTNAMRIALRSNGRIPNLKTFDIPNSDYRGAIIYDRESNNWMKVLLNNNNEILTINSLESELRGGTVRDSFITDMAGMALEEL